MRDRSRSEKTPANAPTVNVAPANVAPAGVATHPVLVLQRQAALLPSLDGFLNAAGRSSANTRAVASRVVAAEFGGGQLGALTRRLYNDALSAAANGSVDLGGINMGIRVEGNAGIAADGNPVIPASGLWSGAGAPAADIGASVDRVAGKLRTGRVPPVRAFGSVLRELNALPAGWTGFRAAAPAWTPPVSCSMGSTKPQRYHPATSARARSCSTRQRGRSADGWRPPRPPDARRPWPTVASPVEAFEVSSPAVVLDKP